MLWLITACSSSNNDKGGAQSPFQKASNGQWLSECQQDNEGNFKETLSLNGASGTTTSQYFHNNDCSGNIVKTDGPTAFNYSSANKDGGKDGEGSVTITAPGRTAVTVQVTVQGNTMSIVSPNGTVLYTRIGGGQIDVPVTGPIAAFDAVAKGDWVTRDCKQINGGGSYLQVITILGAGRAKTVYNVYQDQQCQGNATAQNPTDIVYVVDRYANGGGQITINGQPIDVTIQGAQMTLSSVNGTDNYIKIR